MNYIDMESFVILMLTACVLVAGITLFVASRIIGSRSTGECSKVCNILSFCGVCMILVAPLILAIGCVGSMEPMD